ncbi:MAG: hypothetical protein GXO58_00285 [Thermodesulfobacteria bacterium]|nr:hypothetical protein [Thermodesulfobacteriota bacterium]
MTNNFQKFVSESTKLHQETLAEQIRICEDVHKYSTWFLGLSTIGVGFLIGRFDSILQNSWLAPEYIKISLVIVAIVLFVSIALGVFHHYLSIRERNYYRILIAMFGAQKLIPFFNHPTYPKENIAEDLHNQISNGMLLNYDKLEKFFTTKSEVKRVRNLSAKVLAAQQIFAGMGYIFLFILSIPR